MLVIFGSLQGLRTLEELSFALIVVGVVITALVFIGGFTLVSTWNDIDTRAQTIVAKYEQEAKQEIERNAAERQRAINEVGERSTVAITDLTSKATAMFTRTSGCWVLLVA